MSNLIEIASIFLIIFYCFSIILLFFYSLAQLNLLFNYLKKDTSKKVTFDFNKQEEFPLVTIQLPIYNEKYVIERLLESICKLHYPATKLEIQVLDDSTDDSVNSTKDLVNSYANKGIDIKHITRTNRIGFKAGALKEGLEIAKGEYIVIFDADFVPQEDWLFLTIPYFKNKKVGVVQTRWGHINKNYSILTKVQAFALDTHFTIEQKGRNSKKHCINFNGTAGVWRKSCIVDAGNWESDTLTEDLDLSYRAQIKNWEFIYLEDVVTPAELPAIISAARSQQFRWNKGGAENFIKLYSKIIFTKNLSFKTKFHGLLHLLNSSMFLFIFIISILSIPMLFIKNKLENFSWVFNFMSFFIATTVIFFICYWFTYKKINGSGIKNFIRYIRDFFTFYTIAMGFSFHNTLAVLEGLLGKKSEFVRTPKLNIEALKETWKENVYINKKISKSTIIEGLLAIFFGFGMYSAYLLKDFGLFPFHLMLFTGYSYVFIQSLKLK